MNLLWLTDPHDLQGLPAFMGDYGRLVGAKPPVLERIEVIKKVRYFPTHFGELRAIVSANRPVTGGLLVRLS